MCVGYEIDGKVTKDFPTTAQLEKAKPVLKTFPGWSQTSEALQSMKTFRKRAEIISKPLNRKLKHQLQWYQTDREDMKLFTE